MNEEKKDLKEMVIDLTVQSSVVPERGIVTVNDEVLQHLFFEEKDKIMVYGKDYAVVMMVLGDRILRPSAIGIHKEDLDQLKVNEGGKIKVKAYESLVEKMDELIERLNSKIDSYDKKNEEEKSHITD